MSETPATTPEQVEPLPEGTLVELIRDIPHPTPDRRPFPKGTRFSIEDFVSKEESEDGVAFYWGSRPGNLNDIVAPADAIKLIKTKSEMSARTIPARARIVELLSSEVMVSGDGFRIDETYRDAEDASIECVGETDDGLRFAFTITLGTPQRVDF